MSFDIIAQGFGGGVCAKCGIQVMTSGDRFRCESPEEFPDCPRAVNDPEKVAAEKEAKKEASVKAALEKESAIENAFREETAKTAHEKETETPITPKTRKTAR